MTPRSKDRHQKRQAKNQDKRQGKPEEFKGKKKKDRSKRSLTNAGYAAIAATTIASAKACNIPKLNLTTITSVCNQFPTGPTEANSGVQCVRHTEANSGVCTQDTQGLPQDYTLPIPTNTCTEIFEQSATCTTSGGSKYCYTSGRYGGYENIYTTGGYETLKTSGGYLPLQVMHTNFKPGNDEIITEDEESNEDTNYAFRFGPIENPKRHPATRPTHKDYKGVQVYDGMRKDCNNGNNTSHTEWMEKHEAH